MIINLGTDPKHRGKGYGTLMLENLLASAYCQQIRYVFAITRECEAAYFIDRGFEKKTEFNVFASEQILKRWPKSLT
jgi:N-acetylglutamate synthase-like GNAT family acetyltransferase